jgi:hypothetical protein
MVTRRKVLVCLQMVVALLLVLGAAPAFGDSSPPENDVPVGVAGTARRLASGLEQQGFEVSRGYFKLYTNKDCPMSYEVLGTCLGNNPAAPYVLPMVAPWPDEWVDPALIGAMGKTAKGYGGSFRLAPREAIVLMGVMPPPAAYFGLQTYVFTRQGSYRTDTPQYEFIRDNVPYLLPVFFTTVPNNPARILLFASLSNSNNNVVIAEQSHAVWDQIRYFVITPDRSMDAAVRATLVGLGVDDEDIVTEPIPGNLNLGLGESADDFLTLLRYAMPVDGGAHGTASDRWRSELPFVLLRVRDAGSGAAPLLYPPVTLESRTATDERAYATDLAGIVAGVRARWEQPEATVTPSLNFQSQLGEVGPACTAIGMNCLGTTWDSVVLMSRRFPLDGDPQQVYAVAGTLGTRTDNATYVGLGVNNSRKQLGVGNVSDSELQGSAGGYSPGVADPDKFFVYYFTRDCRGLEALTGGYCFSVPVSMLPKCKDPADLSCELLVFSLRDYIRPGTRRGPDAAQVLSPVVVTLHRPPK